MASNQSRPNQQIRPTDAELEILRVLWDCGASTVREVHESLGVEKDVGYTTTLKLLQRMSEKGLVKRDQSRRSHVYQARLKEEPTQRRMVKDLLTKAFAGSTPTLVMQALSAKKASKTELAEIRELLDELEKGAGK